jgi:hypothetical protein
MRGTKAKVLRMLVYGQKRHRKEHVHNDPRHREYEGKRQGRKGGLTITATGSRRQYLFVKRQFKNWVRDGRRMAA